MRLTELDDDGDEPLPRIASFEPLGQRVCRITWRHGTMDEVDLMPALVSRRGFRRLLDDESLFERGAVNEDGNAIEWGQGVLELSAIWIARLANEQRRRNT